MAASRSLSRSVRWFGVASFAAVAALLLAACGSDPTATPLPTATAVPQATPTAEPAFADIWQELIEAAQAEGTITIAAGGSPSREYRPMVDHFQNLFGIEVILSTGSGSDTVNRVLAERDAGRFEVDIGLVSVITSDTRLVPGGAIDEIRPWLIHPEVLDESLWHGGRHWWGDAAEKLVFLYSASVDTTHAIWYNTDLLSEAEAATLATVDDILDAKWKGQYAALLPDASAGLAAMQSAWIDPDFGPEFVREFLTNMDVTYTNERRILTDWLGQGRFPVVPFPGGIARDLRGLARDGVPVRELQAAKDTPALSAGSSANAIEVFGQAPHPNATKLFLNWFLSRDGQTFLHENIEELDRQSLRNDIPFGQVVENERRVPGTSYQFPDADPAVQPLKDEALVDIANIYNEFLRN